MAEIKCPNCKTGDNVIMVEYWGGSKNTTMMVSRNTIVVIVKPAEIDGLARC